jgi:hypothetical protein
VPPSLHISKLRFSYRFCMQSSCPQPRIQNQRFLLVTTNSKYIQSNMPGRFLTTYPTVGLSMFQTSRFVPISLSRNTQDFSSLRRFTPWWSTIRQPRQFAAKHFVRIRRWLEMWRLQTHNQLVPFVHAVSELHSQGRSVELEIFHINTYDTIVFTKSLQR